MPTIDVAIEILKDYRDGVEMEELREYPIVLNLAIEALEFYKREKAANVSGIWMRLPGETEE